MNLADARHREWMHAQLAEAAERPNVTVAGKEKWGWKDRSLGAPVIEQGTRKWLRLVREHLTWASGDWWTGNDAASALEGVRRPRVLAWQEWDDDGYRLRAELMTFASGRPCSITPELTTNIECGDAWWAQLRQSVDAIAATATERVAVDSGTVERRLVVFFGDQVDPHVPTWTTAHGDLHWANLLRPDLTILDWEFWGQAPFGYDAATLYCYSLFRPAVAERVHATFADMLDSPEGVQAQFYVIARLLLRAEQGDHPGLITPLHRHARSLLADHP